MEETPRPQEVIPDELTFGEALLLVVSGHAKGYTVFGEGFSISYSFCGADETLSTETAEEMLVPMTPKDAQQMYDDLKLHSPGELDEVAFAVDDSEISLN